MKQQIDQLKALIGEKSVLSIPHDMAKYLDEPRKKFHGKALAVARPGDVEAVSATLKFAHEHDIVVVPQGGNTGLVGGQVPDDSGHQIILSLERLTRVRTVDAAQNTMIVEAGVTLENAQHAAQEADRLFPLSLASQGSCTIGGNLASNAGGLNVVAYGSARDLCLGLEVVLADGRIWHGLNALRKNNTGLDLKSLFLGTEGTLGVITAATLKLFPAIHSKATAFVGIKEAGAALELLNIAQRHSGQMVTTIELLPRIGLEFTQKHRQTRDPLAGEHPWYVLLELSSSQLGEQLNTVLEAALSEALDKGIIADAAIAQTRQQAGDFWAIRELLPETQKHEGASIKHDISVPLEHIPAFLDRAERAVLQLIPDARPVPFGHVGDGNIHFNISQPVGADAQAFLDRWDEVNKVVHEVVLKLNGSVSAEHGIGQLKVPLMPQIKSAVELELMRGIKKLLDPKDILNRGKLLP